MRLTRALSEAVETASNVSTTDDSTIGAKARKRASVLATVGVSTTFGCLYSSTTLILQRRFVLSQQLETL